MKLKIKRNTDAKFVQQFSKAIESNHGYCPCRIEKTDDTKCLCKEFREQNTTGWCHCGLYEKVVCEDDDMCDPIEIDEDERKLK